MVVEYGYAKSIGVKQFSGSSEGIDIQVNSWLEENLEVEILDIKFTSNATDGSWGTDALVIYRKEGYK